MCLLIESLSVPECLNMYLHEGKLTRIFNTESSNFNSVYKCPSSKLEYTLAEYEYDLHDANSMHKWM